MSPLAHVAFVGRREWVNHLPPFFFSFLVPLMALSAPKVSAGHGLWRR